MYDTRKRTGIQLCYPFDEKRLEKWGYPVFVQPKLNGERCRAEHNGNSWLLLSSTEELITSVSHITDALNLSSIPYTTELDGELYRHGLGFEEIHSRVSRTVNLHPKAWEIQYHVFDLVDELEEQFYRFRQLRKLWPGDGKNLQLVTWAVANNFEEVITFFETYVQQGYEGIIVRHPMAPYIRRRSTSMMKFKPKKRDVYQVVGKVEEYDKEGRPKGTLGALVCISDGEIFNVGSGFTQKQRKELWHQDAADKLVVVEYQNTSAGRGVPVFGVFLKLIDQSERHLYEE